MQKALDAVLFGGLAIVVAIIVWFLPTAARAEMPSCYIAGMVSSSISTTKAESGAGSVTIAARGLDGTVGAGCDIVVVERFTVGVLARLTFPDVKAALDAGSISQGMTWQAGARLGYLVNSGVLLYVPVGWSGSELKFDGSKVKADGLFYGAGLEIALAPHLALTAEWTRTELGSITDLGSRLNPAIDVARVGIVFRFRDGFLTSKPW